MNCWKGLPRHLPTPLESCLINEMASVAKRAYDCGWTAGTAGNFSVRVRPGVLWISRSGVCKGALGRQDFLPFDYNQNSLLQEVRKASDETPVHAAIVRWSSKVRAVVHCHPPATVRQTMVSRGDLEFSGHEMMKALGHPGHEGKLIVPVIDNTQDMHSLGKSLSEKLNASVPVVVLRGHGVYAWGDSPKAALAYVEGLEFLCQVM